ncbi:MAG: F0F1 ATP synthase subunit delta [Pseudomonadota bacterium]
MLRREVGHAIPRAIQGPVRFGLIQRAEFLLTFQILEGAQHRGVPAFNIAKGLTKKLMSAETTSSGVTRRYAEALFDLARDGNALETVEADLKSLQGAIDTSADFNGFLISPVYDAEEKARAILAFADKAGLSALTRNFLGVIAKNRRLFALQGVVSDFFDRLSEHRGEVKAEATTPAPLNEDQIKRLRGEIEARIGKAVNLTTRVDESLLGGLVVKVGSTMIDSSLRTKLNRLKSKLKEA